MCVVALFTRAWIEIYSALRISQYLFVALFTRAWIEIYYPKLMYEYHHVALFTRAWIEMILDNICTCGNRLSPSLRGRGLKYDKHKNADTDSKVALFTRAWIEIQMQKTLINYNIVALFTRAWIEIMFATGNDLCMFCRPLYEGVD